MRPYLSHKTLSTPGACPPLPLGVSRAVSLTYSHSSLLIAVEQKLFPILKSVIPEVPALSLMAPASSSSGSIRELAGTDPFGKLQQLLTESTLAALLLPVSCHTNLMQKFSVNLMHVFLKCRKVLFYICENLGLCSLATSLTSQF